MAEPVARPRITAIVLAAGMSRRMQGPNKLLLPLHGSTVLARYLDLLAEVALHERIVVLGHERERLRPLLAGRDLRTVENPHFADGLTRSIQAGVAAAAPADGLMICLADQVLLAAQELEALIGYFAKQRAGAVIVRPAWQGRLGHPVLFDACYREEILALTDPDGCRAVLARHAAAVRLYNSPHVGFYADLDTPDDYAALSSPG